MRAVAVLILLAASLAAALLASNRERPLLVERHSPGEWKHDADFPLCVTVKPPPLVKRTKPVFYPRNSETV
jgi:hypothetical protein